eukprot:1190854-Prorocentrum_minimum.AAC.2
MPESSLFGLSALSFIRGTKRVHDVTQYTQLGAVVSRVSCHTTTRRQRDRGDGRCRTAALMRVCQAGVPFGRIDKTKLNSVFY